jgi:DNA-binding beta-propeller fold protein YncE
VCLAVLAAVGSGRAALATPPSNFVNWESPHVAPITMTPDGTRLLAVNTADGRLEVFSLATGTPVKSASIPVGLDPVSVRCRTNTEAWVVNHISDSVSVVDLTNLTVTATLRGTDPAVNKGLDEPWDVVFAGSPQKAYVTFGQSKYVAVWDPAALGSPVLIQIIGEQPRAMGVSPDGTKVYVAIFESGNNTTILGGGSQGTNIGFPPNVVSLATGPYAGVNPPPNSGSAFAPSIVVPTPPKVSLIVRKNGAGQWMDDNAHNWTAYVSGSSASQSGRLTGWDLYDNDVAVIDTTNNNSVTYIHGLMNICMALGVNPATGAVTVVGTDAMNQVRFEPNVKGKFTQVEFASVNPATPTTPTITDLNQHLVIDQVTGHYADPPIAQSERDKSIGDPRGVVFSSSGTTAYVTGMGSNNVIVTSATGIRTPADNVINVGEGPTGLALDEPRGHLYVMNKFAASISTIDTTTNAVVSTTPFFDPTPTVIKTGRKHLYNTHKNSGLGQIACASCHVNGMTDRLSWDLGDPGGASVVVSTANRNLGQGLFGLEPSTTQTAFQNYHPMKGPMTTQTLHAIIGLEPFHWRGDKLGLEEFNGAFLSLQGNDSMLTATEMQEFEDFLATITLPPNPYRNFDNTLSTSLPLPGHFATGRFSSSGGLAAGANLPIGNPMNGLTAYRSQTTRLDMGGFACVTCHTLPTGAGTDMKQPGPTTFNYQPIAVGPNGEHHLSMVSVDGTSNVSTKVPQLRTEYRKVGFNATKLTNTSGFGILHDGSVDSIERFVSEPVFNVTSDQMVADLVSFILSLSGSDLPMGTSTSPLEPPGPPSKDTPASVGVQTTAGATVDTTLINSMIALADAGKVGIIAKGNVGGVQRGYKYNGSGNWKSDRQAEALFPTASFLALASASSPITITVVPVGLQTRLGIDRDEDGWLDRDEISVCSDPADPAVHPGTPLSLDVDGDLAVTVQDIFALLNAWFAGSADFNRDGVTSVQDIFDYLNAWFAGC